MSVNPSQIRAATREDAVACASIYAYYVGTTVISFETVAPTPAQMWQRMDDAIAEHAWLVAEQAGRIVGYCYGHQFAARAAYRWACETSIYLDSDFRGRGVGRALYTELIHQLTGRGYRTALAGITLPNDASVGMHRALGYELAGIFQKVGWKNDSWHDVAWFQRTLGENVDPPSEPR